MIYDLLSLDRFKEYARFNNPGFIAAWNARIESEDINRMRDLLEDVVNALDLSEIAVETHGPLGTEPAELVKLVLQQKDREIALLRHELDELPEWVLKLLRDTMYLFKPTDTHCGSQNIEWSFYPSDKRAIYKCNSCGKTWKWYKEVA